MLRAALWTEDRQEMLLIVGLTDENIERLRDANPILFECDDLGNDALAVMLVADSDERALIAQLKAKGFDLNTDGTAGAAVAAVRRIPTEQRGRRRGRRRRR